MAAAASEMGFKEMEFAGMDRSARKESMHRAKRGDFRLRHPVEIGDRHMRTEFAALARKTGACKRGCDFRLQMRQRWGNRRIDPERAGLSVAEISAPGEFEVEGGSADIGQRRVNLAKPVAIDFADELKRQVKVFIRQPARAVEAKLQLTDRIDGDFGKSESGEKPVHDAYICERASALSSAERAFNSGRTA